MKNYRMKLAYDGTRYEGWQRQQRTEATIQGKLEAVLSRLLAAEVEVHGAGRTDAGVHAKGQVVSAVLSLPPDMDMARLFREVNHYLPEDIALLSIEEAEPRFHARLQALGKHYRYRIVAGLPKPVFERRYVWQLETMPDIEAMRAAAAALVGRHDFKSFCGNRHMKKSTVRCVTAIEISRQGNEVQLDFYGDGFLQYMIRIMTGTLVACGLGRLSPSAVPEILAAKNREAAGPTAPACGLCLMSVQYSPVQMQ